MLRDRTTSEETRMSKFRSSMRAAVYWNEKMADLSKFDIILFSILEYGHYYLLAFELKSRQFLSLTMLEKRMELQLLTTTTTTKKIPRTRS